MYIIAYLYYISIKHAKCNVSWPLIGSCPLISVHFSIQYVSFQVKEKPITLYLSTCSWLWRTTAPGLTVFRVWRSCKAKFKMSSTIRAFIIQSFISIVEKYTFKYIQLERWNPTFGPIRNNCSAHKTTYIQKPQMQQEQQ